MGALMKALSGPSAAAAKRSGVFEEVKDRIDGAMLPQDLNDVERWLDANDHTFPASWREHFNDMIEGARERLAAEDVGEIMLRKYDF